MILVTRVGWLGRAPVVEKCSSTVLIFWCQNREHHTLMDVYYIPQLHSSIISIGQLDEHGSEVLIKDGVLRIRDQEQ